MDFDFNWTGWGVVAGITIALGGLLRAGGLRHSTKESLIHLLSETDYWTQSANRVFLGIFDSIYSGKNRFFQSFWYELLVIPPLLLGERIITLMAGVPTIPASHLLFIGVTGGAAVGVITLKFEGPIQQFLIIPAPTTSTYYKKYWRRIIFALFASFLIGFLSTLYWSNSVLAFGVLLRALGVGIASAILMLLVSFIIAGLLILASNSSINPLWAFLSSLGFVILLGLIMPVPSYSFLNEVKSDFRVSTFLAFNLIADGISLLETRWVLRRTASSGLGKLLVWLAIDFVLSGTIFLFLPFIFFEDLPEFLPAIMFKGDRPWFGILFWSTFSTSVVFYLFFASAFLLRPLAFLFNGVGKIIDFRVEPIVGLTISLLSVESALFVAAAGGKSIYQAMF